MDKVIDILGSIGFDWRVALANFVNFAIVFALVARFVAPAIRRALDERRATIEKGVADAVAAEHALAEAQSREREIVREATLRASDIVSEARTRGDLVISKAHDDAARAGTEMIHRAEDEIARRHKELERSVERDAVALVAQGVRSMLTAGIDDAANDALVERVIDRATRTTTL